jgi:maltose alpha-D-glucosyltransferase/alpha-amylase
MTEAKQKNEILWYKNAVIYQLHVKAFFDSNQDGIGDFKGLTSKLDYIKNLGVTAIWLLPFYPSPLKDDGYDIADYYSVHPDYGTLKDFKEFLKQAHSRGLKVITELVINHTSDQHPWFQRAKKAAPGSNHRDYYVWSNDPEKYKEARIIFSDFEPSNWSWDYIAKAYYWHRFYSHQPDLNFENQNVQKEITKVADFWFDLGVDGMRLDAVPYLFEKEGTNCENLPQTYEFLKKLRKHVDTKYKDKMLLAEANQWPEDAVKYFGQGDICQMAFHFPLMPRMYMALQMEDRHPIMDIIEQTPSLPDNCQWAIFLRNHDELTLEMVTDEERDYMYKMYAKESRAKINVGIRRRLIPLLNNDRKKIELMYMLLFTLPGTPVIYYGDEIGMGDNFYLGDRNGVRTPMQWTSDKNAGFSAANPQQLYLPAIIDTEYHYETVNVANQERNLSSLMWWIRRVIAMRKNFNAFSTGTMEFLYSDNPRVLSFIRKSDDERILCVFNLSRFFQSLKLDMAEYAGYVPEELFSQNKCPEIKKTPYHITLGPHSFYLLSLKKEEVFVLPKEVLSEFPVKTIQPEWLSESTIKLLEEKILPRYLQSCRWFGNKSQGPDKIKIMDKVALTDDRSVYFVILSVKYKASATNYYALPLALTDDPALSAKLINDFQSSVLAKLITGDKQYFLYDGAYDKKLHRKFLEIISGKKTVKTNNGEIIGCLGKSFKKIIRGKVLDVDSNVLKVEQSNTAIVYDEMFFMKLFRRLEEGINSDTEIIRYLTEEQKFKPVSQYAGSIEYRKKNSEPISICLLQNFTINQGDVWSYTLDKLHGFYDEILTKRKELKGIEASFGPLLDFNEQNIPEPINKAIDGLFLDMIKLLGQRTGQMHIALASSGKNKDFKPESFSMLYQKSLYHGMWSRSRKVWDLFRKNINKTPKKIRSDAKLILNSEKQVYDYFKQITSEKLSAMKIRIHGDYHLGQVLFTGKDFVIIDFEGEPAVGLSERRIKRSALRDIAGMLRSFHYAVYAALFSKPTINSGLRQFLEKWAEVWYYYISSVFVRSYLETVGKSSFVPKNKDQFEKLLNFFLLDKAIYELGYEINNRPQWIAIPMKGIIKILNLSLDQK